jgi:hypothetical protein
LQVHEGDVWLQATMEFDGLKAVARFTNDLDLRHDFEESD